MICGPYPAPLGGVSIHIQRLGILLETQGISVVYCDESKERKDSIYNIRNLHVFNYIKLSSKSDIIHIHSSVDVLRLFHILASKILNKKTIITIHSWRKNKIQNIFWSRILSFFCHKIVFVSAETALLLNVTPSKKIIFPAFIPPPPSPSKLPDTITNFIHHSKLNGKKIVVSNAFRIVDFNDEDLYGFDLCLKAFSDPKITNKASLIFIVSDTSVNKKKIDNYIEHIHKHKLEHNILFYLGAIDFYTLLAISDVSIRSTNTDGDALSVRESIFLNIPCIASDCVGRPPEAILFKNRSSDDLIEKLAHCFEYSADLTHDSQCARHIEEFYQKLYE